MDKRKFIYKLNKILDSFKMFTNPQVHYINDIILIRFSHNNYSIERVYSKEQLINIPRECIEEELASDLRALYYEGFEYGKR